MCTAFFSLLEKKDYEYITIKDVCKEANVNRSTFYLHYETMDDLLEESVDRKIQELEKYLSPKALAIKEKIKSCTVQELDFITPEYLVPYLTYVKDNRKIFFLFFKKSDSLRLQKKYAGMMEDIILPVLDRYQLDQTEQKYLFAFCLNGLLGIIQAWLETDCQENVETIYGFMSSFVHSIDMKKQNASE